VSDANALGRGRTRQRNDLSSTAFARLRIQSCPCRAIPDHHERFTFRRIRVEGSDQYASRGRNARQIDRGDTIKHPPRSNDRTRNLGPPSILRAKVVDQHATGAIAGNTLGGTNAEITRLTINIGELREPIRSTAREGPCPRDSISFVNLSSAATSAVDGLSCDHYATPRRGAVDIFDFLSVLRRKQGT
jgi:hypothetical protein